MHQGDIFRNLKLFRTYYNGKFQSNNIRFFLASTKVLASLVLASGLVITSGASSLPAEVVITTFTAPNAYLVIVTLAIPILLHQLRVSVINVS